MTKPGAANPSLGGLKAALAIGSVVASLLGARLAAVKDAAAAAASRPAITAYPAQAQQAQPAAPGTTGTTSVGPLGNLPPVPTIIAPAPMSVMPVTTTQSSR